MEIFQNRKRSCERFDGAPAARGAVKELRRCRGGFKESPQARVIHFPDCSSRITGGGPESSRRSTWEVAARFRFSHDGKCRRPSARKAERCASLIRTPSRSQLTLPWQWSRFMREGCGNCTGTPMPTNGSITSLAKQE